MIDKVYLDLKQATLPIHERQLTQLDTYLKDNLIMKYGYYKIAMKLIF